MTSQRNETLARARVLDAEMQLQRAWLDLSLRDLSGSLSGTARNVTAWAKLAPLGVWGLSLIKHRSLWLAAISLAVKLFRRHPKEKP
jgi:hypothetical protein